MQSFLCRCFLILFLSFGFSLTFILPLHSEENIYKLAEYALDMGFHEKVVNTEDSNLYVMFISSPDKFTMLNGQKESEPIGLKENLFTVYWDYHVVLLAKSPVNSRWYVYDYDSRFPTPCAFSDYFDYTIKTTYANYEELPQFHHYFRVMDAREFVKVFSSTREHMRYDPEAEDENYQEGDYAEPPPEYPAIVSAYSHDDLLVMAAKTKLSEEKESYLVNIKEKNIDLSKNNIDVCWDMSKCTIPSSEMNAALTLKDEDTIRQYFDIIKKEARTGFGAVMKVDAVEAFFSD